MLWTDPRRVRILCGSSARRARRVADHGLASVMRPSTLAIQRLTDIARLANLALEAIADGHGMVARLLAEWSTGENRFDRPGERS